jgi:outer membrane lipoprotein-sorting protein
MVDVGKKLSCLCLGLLLSLPGWAQTAAPAGSADLQKVLTQLDTAAARFASAQADFTWDQYTAVVQQDDVQSGAIYFERKKGVTRTAVDLKLLNGKPAPKTVVFDGAALQYYEPNIKQLTTIQAGANRGQFESFLTLGFGGSGASLEANWKVSLLGAESMNGVSVVELDLVPKQPKVLDTFPHVTIWVDPARGVSLKQIFYEPGGDKRTVLYKDIRYNQPIAAGVFEIKPAPGTTMVKK